MSEVDTRGVRAGHRLPRDGGVRRALAHRPSRRRAADHQLRARTTPPRTGCCGCSRRSRARSCGTSSRSSATSTRASRRPPRTRRTGRPSPSSSGWTTSPTTSTRWRSAARSRRCSTSRCRRARSTCASIHMELNRIMSHLVWLGTTALDLGAISMFWYCFRDREQILDLFEMSSGQRMHTRYFQVGGVFEDIPVGWEQKVRAFAEQMPERVDQFLALLMKNEIVAPAPAQRRARSTRRRCSASASPGRCCAPRATRGTCARPSPTRSYEDFDFKIPVGTTGDNWDRMIVRMVEMKESVRIIEQALDGLPEGPYITDDRKYALPPRHELATSMEALIHHFKLVTEGFRVPPGEVYYPIESPRGEMGCFVRADGSSKPARVHMRDPSFVNLQAFRPMAQRPLHRRLHRHARHARPGARRDRPLSHGHRPHPRPPLRARLPRPRLGRRRRPHEGAGRRARTRRRRRCPTTCARRSRTTWPATRTSAPRRSRRCTPRSGCTAGARRPRSSRSRA